MTVSRSDPPFFPFLPVRTGVFKSIACAGRPQAKLISITAPTGYGKTVLLTALHQHYRAAGAACHWLALDDRDASIERVIVQLEAALFALRPEVNPLQALHQGDEPVEERIGTLLDSLALVADPSVLIIDNLGYCTDDTLNRLLDALIFRTPSWLTLVLSSTGVPPYDHSRAKLEGRLRQIGFAELSLCADEVRELLGAELCARLSDSAIEAIVRQTEGWPAAVRLMQIILSAAENPEAALSHFSGADEDLAALLNRQVLQGFEPAFRQFLLEVSLLRTFGVNLCRQATGDARAAEHVQLLLKRNLFVLPLDRNRSWYRLHALFREFLLDEAGRQIPLERRREILSRAAEWCEHGGYWQDAIDYALAADSAPLAAAILERVAAMFVRDRGDLHQYIEWVEQLHAAGDRGGWETDFWYVWALVFHRRYEYARKQLQLLSLRLQRDGAMAMAPAEAIAYQRRLEVIRLAIDVYTDRLADARHNAMQWLPGVAGDDPFNVATVGTAAAICRAAEFDYVEAHQTSRRARSSIMQAQSEYGVGWVEAVTAMIAMQEGDYAAAHQDVRAALTRAKAALGEGAGMTGTLALLAAKSAVEMNLDAEAADLLTLGLRRATSHGLVDTAALGLDAAVKLWQGETTGNLSIARLREIASAYPPRLSLMLSCFLIRRYLRLGRGEDALREAAQIGLSTNEQNADIGAAEQTAGVRELRVAAEIDLHIVTGRLKQAGNLIADEIQRARSHGRNARLVELAIDEAGIALYSHNPAPAARHLTRAVSLAARRRHLRPFRDRAELIAGVVNETKPKDWGFAVEEERRFFAEICRGLPSANGALLNQLVELDAAPALSETPTARELELLSLVEAGLSNQQLADRLSVSLATVKWHLYNLYTKLGVSSRAAALARARALNLLSR